MKSTDLRPGMAIKLDGKLYVITQYTHVTPGNLRAFIQVKIRDLASGSIDRVAHTAGKSRRGSAAGCRDRSTGW